MNFKVKEILNMKKKIAIITVTLILLFGIGIGIYVGDYYHADEAAIKCIKEQSEGVTVMEKDGNYIFMPDNPIAGVIFYPGGKVQAESYAPLMKKLAEADILTVLVPMPGNLAVLGINKAEGLKEEYPNIQKWYMAGHSLGGSMAASYLGEHGEEYAGLLLLASYSTECLTEETLEVLSVYGDCDEVLNMEAYEENSSNLPAGYEEVIIEGGCHAYFGSYGEQKGDGISGITREEQLEQTAEIIEEFVKENKDEHKSAAEAYVNVLQDYIAFGKTDFSVSFIHLNDDDCKERKFICCRKGSCFG